jgi:hypothetical protein
MSVNCETPTAKHTQNDKSTDDDWIGKMKEEASRVFLWFGGHRTVDDTSARNPVAAEEEHGLNGFMSAVCNLRCFKEDECDVLNFEVQASKSFATPSRDVEPAAWSSDSPRCCSQKRVVDIYHTTASISQQQIPLLPLTPREPAPSLLPVNSRRAHHKCVVHGSADRDGVGE